MRADDPGCDRDPGWRRLGAGLLGLGAGLALVALLPGAVASSPSPADEAALAREGGAHGPEAETAASAKSRSRPAKLKPKRSAQGGAPLVFTRSQWAQIMRNPRHYYLHLSQLFPVLGADELPDGRAFDGRGFLSDPHPTLWPQEQLFGWTRDQRYAVREQALAFARELMEAEKAGAKLDYPEAGLIRIDFSGAREGREAAFEALRRNLEATVGRADAERFLALACLSMDSPVLADELTIRARYEGDQLILTGAEGWSQTLPRPESWDAEFQRQTFVGRYEGRILHLMKDQPIDWARLNPEPDASGEEAGQ